jgi:porphobilinogen deaminase
VVGTASLRRQAMVKRRPDIAVVPFRGNVRPGRTADDGVA